MNFSRFSFGFTGWIVLTAFACTSLLPGGNTALAAPPVAPLVLPPAPAPWAPPKPILSEEHAAVTVPPVTPPRFASRLTATPDESELRDFRALGRPLLQVRGRSVTGLDRIKTARVLERYMDKAYERPTARLEVLMEHLRAEPNSPYALSLLLEVSAVARKSGEFILAIETARKAWSIASAPGDEIDEEALQQAEETLGNLATLYAQLGQRQALTDLLASIKTRAPHPASSEALAQAGAMLAGWNFNPELAALCGLRAYNVLAAQLGGPLLHKPTAGWGEPDPAADAAEGSMLTEQGLSAAALVARVQALGSNWRWVKRMTSKAIPFPAVVHLQFGSETGHYSALVQGGTDSTRLVDSYLHIDAFLENSTISRQTSGFFMVPGNLPLPEGFIVASNDDLNALYGRYSCPYGNDDEGCNTPKGSCGGMAVASVSRFLPGLIVQDEPLTYRPEYGPAVDFRLEYRGVQLHGQNTFETSNLGPLWTHGFSSGYVVGSSGNALPDAGSAAVFSNGTYFLYNRPPPPPPQTVIVNGQQQVVYPAPDPYAPYLSKYGERPTLTWLFANQGGPGYRLKAADGSYQDFTQPNNGSAPTRYYLTRITDAQGYTVTLGYDALFRLSTITDATGKPPSTLIYSGSDRKIRGFKDPFNRTASFTYDGMGRLQSITDALGIVSSFTYDAASPQRISTLTTPYGTTQVAYEGTPVLNDYGANWSVMLTDPEGYSSRVEHFYHDGHTPFTEGANPEERPPESIMVGSTAVPFLTTIPQEDHFHVTLEWDKKQWYHYQADKAANPTVDSRNYAEYTLWLMRASATVSQEFTAGVPVATRRPGESARWYNYDGQVNGAGNPSGAYIGTSAQPSKVARQVEDENGVATWVMTQQSYSDAGLPLISTDERGRQTQLTFVGDADVSSVKALTAPSTWTTLRAYTYPTPNHHRPATVTELSGVVTTYSYNAKDQITQLDTSKGGAVERVRGTYNSTGIGTAPAWPGTPGYLVKIERTDPANASGWVTTDEFTYDGAGRVRTHKDAGSYQRTFDYDNFDRPTLITHPDSTTEQFSYKRLDRDAAKDRAGRWTRTLYNPRRQPVAEIAPDGKLTQFEWCLCGQLQKLTDPLGRVTKWTWTIGGRNTEKLLPDGITKTTYTYQPRSGRLATVTRPNDQAGGNPTVAYSYEVDGRLKKEDYTDAATSDVAYTYEPVSLGRLTGVADGIGTHALAYVPFTAGTAGAGRLEFADGPLTDDRVQRVYDWKDRVGTTNLVADAATTNLRTETFAWDSLGRPKTIDNTLGTFTYGYTTSLRRPDSLAGPNTVSSAFTYYPNTAPGDGARRLAGIAHLRGTVAQASHLYGYDKAGRITGWEQQSIGHATVQNAYRYNLGDELTGAEKTEGGTVADRESWGLDQGGNWLSHTRSATSLTETRTVNSLNQLTQIGGAGSTVVEGSVNEFAKVTVKGELDGQGEPAELRADPVTGGYRFQRAVPVKDGDNEVVLVAIDTEVPPKTTTQKWKFNVPAASRTFTYDLNGNTLTDGVRTLTWDAKNRLKSAAKDGTTWTWDYDYLDRRVRESVNGTLSKVFIYSGTEIVQERDAGNAITRTHYFGGFSDGATPASGTKYQTLADHLGNIREVLTPSGTLAAHYTYTAYQDPVKLGTSTVDPTFLTIGRYYHHQASGLEFALYRAYDPALGRWLSQDPIEEAGGLNLYSYVLNRPVVNTDPLGLSSGIWPRPTPQPGPFETCVLRCVDANGGGWALAALGISTVGGGTIPKPFGAGALGAGKCTTVPSLIEYYTGLGLRQIARRINPVMTAAQCAAAGYLLGATGSCAAICAGDNDAY